MSMNDGWESPDESTNVQTQSNTQQRTKYFSRSTETSRKNFHTDQPWDEIPPENIKPRNNRDMNWRQNKIEKPCVEINVPTNMVGKIIGRGGAKISEMQDDSNARIVVTKEESNGRTIVKLFGDEGATSRAEELIREVAKEKKMEREVLEEKEQKPFKINWKELSEECDRCAKENWAKLPVIKKNLYVENEEVAKLSAEEVNNIRAANYNTSVRTQQGEEAPKPVWKFEQAFAPWPQLLKLIQRAGFERPSPVQAQAWPALLSGRDVIAIAQTGTGKTLAFLLPGLVHISSQPENAHAFQGPRMLVLAPTRELALQIEREVKKFPYGGVRAVCLYGGGSRREQVDVVTRGVQVVIATPGRLNDLLMNGLINVSGVSFLVLDEADRMLDMGFEPQIRKTLLDIRPDRQTVMTSATWPTAVRRLASSYTCAPLHIQVGSLDLAPVHSVSQTVLVLPGSDDTATEEAKFRELTTWLQQMGPNDKAIVFCGQKARADFLAAELASLHVDCQCLHGGREQSDRESALADIASGRVRILIATDLAARGLDVDDVTHVINYDFPRQLEEYVHRVGRTGRAGRTGEAVSYLTRRDWGTAGELAALLRAAKQTVPPELDDMAKRFERRRLSTRAQ